MSTPQQSGSTTTVVQQAVAENTDRRDVSGMLKRQLQQSLAFGTLVVLVIFFAIASPAFFTVSNLTTVLLSTAVIAILAVVKAGAASVPIDPAVPAARREFVLADAAPVAVVTTVALADQVSSHDLQVILTDGPVDHEALKQPTAAAPLPDADIAMPDAPVDTAALAQAPAPPEPNCSTWPRTAPARRWRCSSGSS